ncbi:MarR family winged helix-turn-helix transcriptional regulator [Humibacter albus]|jgi:DNA-binding MarR family transcriptional regulator|uniref:MarR family winged helix-turn-helix transcriptional regulator n=1 Tax=Humibacter albus TaxID=427754 RepID=UPI0003B3A6DE|nr:MarR family winged helix-turn-helix transcriptional regulator [Humibacter albus]
MKRDPIDVIEYETMLFGRHLMTLPGRSRRSGGTLDQSAYTLLNLLEVGGPMSIGELVSVTGLDASTLNRQTAALVRGGHSERIAASDGGIARKFRLTPAGAAALAEERAASRASLAVIVEDWPRADRERFATLLQKLNRTIEERSGRQWPRVE